MSRWGQELTSHIERVAKSSAGPSAMNVPSATQVCDRRHVASGPHRQKLHSEGPQISSETRALSPQAKGLGHTDRVCAHVMNPTQQRPFKSHKSTDSSHTFDAHTSGMVQMAKNASVTMSLRGYLYWIVTLDEVHKYQSVNHTQANNTSSLTASAVAVLRNLQVLETMYRPGRVKLPNEYTRQMVNTIHDTLQRLKLEMENRFEELTDKSRNWTAGPFIEWVTSEYKVANRRLVLNRRGFRRNPDSAPLGRQSDVYKAMEYYCSPDILHEKSATNIFASMILKALESFIIPYPTTGPSDYEITKQIWKEWRDKRKLKKRVKISAPLEWRLSAPEDKLLCEHPSPP